MTATWDADRFTYSIDGAVVADITAKGASDALAQQANANIRVLADRLMANTITLQEWYTGMKKETKILHMAEAALARGGFDQMREMDWLRVEKLVAQQWEGIEGKFPGLRSFATDIRDGRYGKGENLERGFLSRSGMYGDAGRLTYENERLAMRIESGVRLEAKRVKGANDHCPDCIAWADLGWIDALEMMAKYYIGASVCGGRCWCVIVTRPAQADDGVSAIGGSSGPPADNGDGGSSFSNDDRPYLPARYSRDPEEWIQEIQATGALDNTERAEAPMGRWVAINPRTGGDAILEQIAARQGFDGLPALGNANDLEDAVARRIALHPIPPGLSAEKTLMAEGETGKFRLFRNVFAKGDDVEERLQQYVNDFRNGPYFAGVKNTYGNGTYFWPWEQSEGEGAAVIQAAFRENARIVTMENLQAEMKRSGYDERIPVGYNHGHYAAAKGYDAIFVAKDNLALYVVLNRTSLIVLA